MRGHTGDSCPQPEDIKGKLALHHILRNKDIKSYLKTLTSEKNNIFLSRRGLGEANQEDEEIAAEDEEDMGVIETYSNYMPSKLKVRNSLLP